MLAADAASHHKPFSRQLALALDARAALLGVTLGGFALRLALLDRFALHPDEAIYSFWALYGRTVDPLFLHVWPDKPPILIWLLGWLFELAGATSVMARLPNLVFSTLTVVITGALARHWWGARAGLLAALLMALNPFAISFAATAFTDPLMVMAGLLATYAAARRRCFWSGLWLGVALMTKQQGVLFVPLVLAVAGYGLRGARGEERGARGEGRGARHSMAAIVRWLGGLLLVVAPILYWDSLRWAVAPSPWDLGARNAAGFALAAPAEWPPRLWAWLELARYLLGSVWTWLLLLAAVIVSFSVSSKPHLSRQSPISTQRRKDAEARRANSGYDSPADFSANLCASAPLRQCQPFLTASPFPPAAILAAWALGFLALHVVTSVQVWDRYLLPLAPVVALLGAFGAEVVLRRGEGRVARGELRGASCEGRAARGEGRGARGETSVLRTWRGRMPSAIVVLLVAWLLLLTGPAIEAVQGRVPIGGDRGAYTGVEQVAAWLTARVDSAPVVYQRTLGWHFAFLLFAPMQEGRIDVRWTPSAVQLADNAAKTPHLPRYWVEADWAPARDLSMQLAVRGLAVQERLRAGRFTLYEIIGAPSKAAAWRVCEMPPAHGTDRRWQILGAATGTATSERCVAEMAQ